MTLLSTAQQYCENNNNNYKHCRIFVASWQTSKAETSCSANSEGKFVTFIGISEMRQAPQNFQQAYTSAFFSFSIFFKAEISSCTLIVLFTPDLVHWRSVSRDECSWVFPNGDKLRVSSFPWQVPTLCLDSLVGQLQLVGSRVCASLGVVCHLHFWQNDWVIYVPLW